MQQLVLPLYAACVNFGLSAHAKLVYFAAEASSGSEQQHQQGTKCSMPQPSPTSSTTQSSIESMQCAEFWVLDTDAKLLPAASVCKPHAWFIHLCAIVLAGAQQLRRSQHDAHPRGGDAQLSPAELSRLAGQAAVAAASAAGQRPGSPVATCGVAFLVAGAGGVPGGSTLLLQVAKYLRSAGFFVVAALTRPFEFEGRRKLEEADALIETLREVADLVDTCKAILWALNVPEVLKSTAGSMLWHGRDLRQYKRLLSPPLEVLQTCPGIGGLGRGMASRPVATLARRVWPGAQQPGTGGGRGEHPASRALAAHQHCPSQTARAARSHQQHLDAALESPFLEHAMPRAGGVLCVLSLPQRVLSHDLSLAEGALNDPEKYAIRAECSLLVMEASLLVLEDPAAAEEGEWDELLVGDGRPGGAVGDLPPSAAVWRHQQRRDADGRHGSSTSNAQQPAGAPGSGVPGSAAGVGIEGFAGSSVDLDDDDDDDDDEDVVRPLGMSSRGWQACWSRSAGSRLGG
ncbi:hypothetical protein COO60DRAFT_1671815 [Scenedesmus sp. NREL 46B-D3]|nr:hypothetical protein COO60DRAFT_1671815 [Scenedesmus sp. NREL 46B-D3]